MRKRFLATAAAVATLAGGVAVPAQAVQTSGYNGCYITYSSKELRVLRIIQDKMEGDLKGIYIHSGNTDPKDAAVIAKVIGIVANNQDDTNTRIALRAMANANKKCAGDEYYKTHTAAEQAQLALDLARFSSEEGSSKDSGSSKDKGSSEDKKNSSSDKNKGDSSSDQKKEDNALSTKDGELTEGGIALVVTAVLLVLGMLASAVPGLRF